MLKGINSLAFYFYVYFQRKLEKKLPFSTEAIWELKLMWSELHSMVMETSLALAKGDTDIAKNVLRREERINQLQIDLKKSHVHRLNEGTCNLQSGIVFLDLVDNLEKIGDHLSNIAEGVMGGMRWRVHEKTEKKEVAAV